MVRGCQNILQTALISEIEGQMSRLRRMENEYYDEEEEEDDDGEDITSHVNTIFFTPVGLYRYTQGGDDEG